MKPRKIRIISYCCLFGAYILFAFPGKLSYQCNPYQKEAKSTLGQISRKVEEYLQQYNVLPKSLEEIGFDIHNSGRYRYEFHPSSEYRYEIKAVSKGWRYPAYVGEGDDVWKLDQDLYLTNPVSKCKGIPLYFFDYIFLVGMPVLIIIELLFRKRDLSEPV